MIIDGKYGNFRKIMALELNLHILVPIFVLLGFISGFVHIIESINSLGSDPATFLDFPLIEKIMLSADILVLILLFSGLAGIPVPGGRTSLTFFSYMMILFHAQALIIFGKSLHKWQQVPSVRESLAEHDRLEKQSKS